MHSLACKILQREMGDSLILHSHSRESYCLLFLRHSFVYMHIFYVCAHMHVHLCACACQKFTSAIIPHVLSTLLILRQSLWSFE